MEKLRQSIATSSYSAVGGMLAKILGLAGIYFLFAKFGLTLATLSQSASPVWPATGLAFAIVYIYGNKGLVSVALGALAANSLTEGPFISAVAISIGNTGEAFVGSFLIRWILSKKSQYTYQTEMIAFGISSALGSLVSATIGVASLYATGNLASEILATVWMTWWIGDTLGGLVVTPLIVQFKEIRLRPESWLKAIAILAFGLLAIYFVFFNSLGGSYLFLLFPILLFSVRHLGNLSVLLVSAVVCAVSIAATVKGFGPFAHGNLNERLVHLQLFLAAFALTGLALSGLGRQKLSRVPALVLAVCWFLAGSIFYSFDRSEKDRALSKIEHLAMSSQEKTLWLISSYEDAIRSGVALFSASKDVEYEEWKAFTSTLNVSKRHAGINGLGVIWPVSDGQINKFKVELKKQGVFPFGIKPVPGYEDEFTLSRKEHYIIKFIEPIEFNRAALGLDVSSEPKRKFAADLSRDTGLGTLTGKILLIQDQKRTPGALFFLPIYRNEMKNSLPEGNRKIFLGWVYAPIVYRNFFAEVFRQTTDELELQVFEGKDPIEENLVFSNFTPEFGGRHFVKEVRLQMGQNDYIFRWAKSSQFGSSHNTIVAWVGFCGALASLMLTNLMVAAQLVGQRSRQIADELTKELSESREKFKQGERRLLYALDGSNDGIWDWNIEKGEMYVSGKIASTHGWPTVFCAHSTDDLEPYAHPDDLNKIGRSIHNVLSGRSASHEVETRYRTTSGEWQWVLTRGKISERDEFGNPKRMTGVHIDIHDLKITQSLLTEKEYQLSNIANSVPAHVSLWNKDLRCEFANEMFGNWFGVTAGEIIGKAMSDLVNPQELEERRPVIENALRGEFLRYEREVLRPSDQEKRYVIVTYLPNMKNAVLDGFFLFIQDITELKKAEILAIEGRKSAEEAANIKSQFLANMSHEIRTPLNGIIGMVNILKRTQLDKKQEEYAEVISRSSDSLLNLINDILDFSKVEAGKLDIEIVDFNLKNLVSDVIKTFSFSAQEKKIALKVDLQLGKSLFFKGDPGRIRQVLTNLVGNAIKFTSNGSVTLRVLADERQASVKLKFEILDTGIGIPKQSLGRMFQAFSQADSSMTRRFGGSGLGLSICKQLVHLMGGEIGVVSEPGKGSRFWFCLELPVGIPIETTRVETISDRTLNARILIVEDNRVNQHIALEFLGNLGYVPHAVGNGIEALDALREATYDIVLMDCQMPDMDGFQATQIIRRSESLNLRFIPIIAMTANALSGDRAKCLAAGMTDYVSKPIDENQLVMAIERCLRKAVKISPKTEHRYCGHVLVVEDNKVNQTVLGLNLEGLNYTFDIADNGLEALEYLSDRTCDLILMDCQMPEMDGYEAARRIRLLADTGKSQIPIIAVTANALKGDREKCLTVGMNDYLAKPINVENLKSTLEMWIRKRAVPIGFSGEIKMENRKTRFAIDMVAIDKLRKLQKPGRPSLLNNLIGLFIESANEGIEQIRDAVKRSDLTALSAAAHSLKSSSANLGALEFSNICLQLEMLGDKEGSGDQNLEELMLRLEQEFKIVLIELEGLKASES